MTNGRSPPPRPTHEDPGEAHRIVSGLLADMDDLVGIFVIGGISGVLQALREAPDRRRPVRLVCRDLGPETRKGLAEGLITAALVHPLMQRAIPFDTVAGECLTEMGRVSPRAQRAF